MKCTLSILSLALCAHLGVQASQYTIEKLVVTATETAIYTFYPTDHVYENNNAEYAYGSSNYVGPPQINNLAYPVNPILPTYAAPPVYTTPYQPAEYLTQSLNESTNAEYKGVAIPTYLPQDTPYTLSDVSPPVDYIYNIPPYSSSKAARYTIQNSAYPAVPYTKSAEPTYYDTSIYSAGNKDNGIYASSNYQKTLPATSHQTTYYQQSLSTTEYQNIYYQQPASEYQASYQTNDYSQTPYLTETSIPTPYSTEAVYMPPYKPEIIYSQSSQSESAYSTPYADKSVDAYQPVYAVSTPSTTAVRPYVPTTTDTPIYLTDSPVYYQPASSYSNNYYTPYPVSSAYPRPPTAQYSNSPNPYTTETPYVSEYNSQLYTSLYNAPSIEINIENRYDGHQPYEHDAQCTWDGTQINDPEILNPVPSYAFTEYPHHPPRPGTIDPDIATLVNSLSLKAKIGQMAQIEVGKIIDCNGMLNMTAVKYWIGEWNIGSFLETPGNHGGIYNLYSAQSFGKLTDAVQKVALENGSKIPVIWGLDSVRGANYVKGAVIFPAGIATAATFNPNHAYDAGRIAAKDTRAAGVHWAFAPISDLPINKLWSRVYENFGEDPFLSSRMTAASVAGYQGDYKHDRTRVAASVKHFIGYGNPFDGADRSNRHIAAHELLEYYVPPFKAAIDAGVATVMESYGFVNSEPVVMSQYYLQSLLRKHLGFAGMLVTDWGEINSQAESYHTAADITQATWAALNRTSIDMSMVPEDESFCMATYDLVVAGIIPEQRINESVMRILQLKKDLGLFDNPFVDRKLQDTVGSAQDIEAARNSVRESVTLLKNRNGVLPLKHEEKILFVGPTLNSTRYMGGGWNVHWQGPTDEEGDAVYQGFGDTILKGVQQVTGSNQILYYKGTDIDGQSLIDLEAIIKAGQLADKIVVGLGEKTYAEIPGNIDRLQLPQNQIDLVNAIARGTKKPIVVVLVEGRPRILDSVANVADGVVQAYLPGAYGGLPIAEILYGKVNPSGRLPYTYPANESQASTIIWQSSYSSYSPQWAFGSGLGYSNLEYTNATVSATTLKIGEPITVSVSITNHGPYPQKEPVMLFTNQPYRFNMSPDNYRLREFAKIELAVGQTKKVDFQLKAEDLSFWDRELNQRIESSLLVVAINPYAQKDIRAEVALDVGNDYVLAKL
ncbi:hypothetical protein GGI07_001525 [Coemansia sp. Benny D115]|nr:hypothetical protein GGI07_001525 [Coemansia sp. Benny D115]